MSALPSGHPSTRAGKSPPWTPGGGGEELSRRAQNSDRQLVRRMPEQDEKKREAPISYRPPKELRAEFDERVLASALSTSAFITKCVFGRDPPRRSRRPSIEHQDVAQILATLGQVRDRKPRNRCFRNASHVRWRHTQSDATPADQTEIAAEQPLETPGKDGKPGALSTLSYSCIPRHGTMIIFAAGRG